MLSDKTEKQGAAVDARERHKTEQEYFDRFIERKGGEIEKIRVDEKLVPPVMRRFVDALTAHFKGYPDLSKVRVLDFGCGYGVLGILLAKNGLRVFSFDLSRRMAELAARLSRSNGVAARVHVEVAAGEHIPFADGSFDTVVGTRVLHHLDVARAGEEIHRVLKTGGKAFFWEATYKGRVLGLLRTIARAIPGFPIAGTRHEHPLSREEIDGLARRFGGRIQLRAAPFSFFAHLAMVIFRGESETARRLGERLDSWIEKLIPSLGHSSFHQILILEKADPDTKGLGAA